MRELILFRHGKSSWDDPELDDFARPLAPRGAKAAGLMSEWLVEKGLVPDHVLCSPAVRTRATLALAVARFSAPKPSVEFLDELYLANPATILAAIRNAPPERQRCMVVGHNPGLHALALELVGSGGKKQIEQMALKFPTAAVAHLSFAVDGWEEVAGASGKLENFATPRRID